jgi:hypothetical protein
MFCYECSKAARSREAVGLCHHCSAALCAEHVCVIADPVTTIAPVVQTVVLPRAARLLLCPTCMGALQQLGVSALPAEAPKERRPPAAA